MLRLSIPPVFRGPTWWGLPRSVGFAKCRPGPAPPLSPSWDELQATVRLVWGSTWVGGWAAFHHVSSAFLNNEGVLFLPRLGLGSGGGKERREKWWWWGRLGEGGATPHTTARLTDVRAARLTTRPLEGTARRGTGWDETLSGQIARGRYANRTG